MTQKEFYRRNLPHIQPLGGTFFVTYRLHDSVPAVKARYLKEYYEKQKSATTRNGNKNLYKVEKQYFIKFDQLLDKCESGVDHLKKESIAQEVAVSLHYWDKKKMDLISYCIMPNHVHAVFTLYQDGHKIRLNKLMHSIKLFSAKKCNKLLNKKGRFWQEESFDRLIRDRNELYRVIEYVLDNPVKAGLCQERKDWPWNYINPDYNEFM